MGRGSVNGIGQGLHDDLTTTGAVCISSLHNAAQGGRGVLRLGDTTTPCKKCGKTGVIIDSLPAMKWHGVPTVLDGAEVRCGCPPGSNRLIAPIEKRKSTGSSSSRSTGVDNTPAPITPPTPFRLEKTFAQAFAITDSESGLPLANRKFVAVVDGRETIGVTDVDGLVHIRAPSEDSVISLHVMFKSPVRTLTELSEKAQ
ncbi:hypothetical protein PS874_03386 [Pseudomonas fluorescens]|jgi:uncharacterized Zn-binding protein involved in type VI secretion|nr:hypothetical protein PS874_03386 [Pseudomonas fluorescens]